MPNTISYKIFQINEWDSLQSTDMFMGSPADLKDGFIHLSDAHQLQGTLDKHYTDHKPVIIAAISTSVLGDALKYETSRGGDKFPHLYAPLPKDAVSQYWRVSPDASGRYEISHIN